MANIDVLRSQVKYVAGVMVHSMNDLIAEVNNGAWDNEHQLQFLLASLNEALEVASRTVPDCPPRNLHDVTEKNS